LLAVAPDLDLLVDGLHRSVTHSIASAAAVALIAAAIVRRTRSEKFVETHLSTGRVALMCAAAWASHMGVDWVSADQSNPRGLQILWPFNETWFISGWDLFPGTERRRLFSEASFRRNAQALVTELVLLLPILLTIWLVRVKTLAGLATEMPRGNHPSK
jgi:membrane-bound metal-dependent hydrolase YbcI (DUF457 family)